jgi:hypothetical protein
MPVIRLKSLEFFNGFAYKHCKISLDQQGLVLVRGLNCDEGGFLGAGKTSIFEVGSQLLTGRTGKHQRGGDRVSVDGLVNKLVGKDFSAFLTLSADDHPYEISQLGPIVSTAMPINVLT